MYKLQAPRIKLPLIMVCESEEDVNKCKSLGGPYIIWKGTKIDLLKLVLLPYVEKKFPYIDWYKEGGIKEHNQAHVNFGGGGSYEDGIEEGEEGTNDMELGEYVSKNGYKVDIEALKKLDLLPTFMSDVAEAIKINLSKVKGTEGYNKKHGLCIGNIKPSKQMRNLIILDISGSIPRGISDTMIALIETYREMCSADVIITSDISHFYPYEHELPTPEHIRSKFGLGNEKGRFLNILQNELPTKHYNNIISFGDDDHPHFSDSDLDSIKHLKCNHVWHFHTGCGGYRSSAYNDTGYAKGVHEVCSSAKKHYDESGVRNIKPNEW